MTEAQKQRPKKKKRSFLLRAFRRAAVGLFAVATLYTGWYLALYAGRGQKLTKGERALVEGIFGKEIDANKIRKHMRGDSSFAHILPSKIGMVPPPFSHIDFYGAAHHFNDYSKADRKNFGLFAHEATHCWQGQTWTFPLNNIGVYEFKLSKNSRFNDFGTEQQAEIIETYAQAFLFDDPKYKPTADDSLAMNVIEKRFPQAKKTRLAFQKQHRR